MFIVSRCLLGFNCKYDGGNNKCDELIEFCRTHDYVTVCPETAAGLPAPRFPAEITAVEMIDEKCQFTVMSNDGKDMSEAFDYGARLSLASVLTEAGSRKDRNGVFADKLIDACLEERSNPHISDDNRLFADTFRVCDENNFSRVFGIQTKAE